MIGLITEEIKWALLIKSIWIPFAGKCFCGGKLEVDIATALRPHTTRCLKCQHKMMTNIDIYVGLGLWATNIMTLGYNDLAVEITSWRDRLNKKRTGFVKWT